MDITGLIDKLIGFLPADLQEKLKTSRKAIVGVIGTVLTVLTFAAKFLPESQKKTIATVISALTAVLTYLVPNG